MTRVLVVGYGSIGARHSRLAVEAGVVVGCLTGNPACPYQTYNSLEGAVAAFLPSHIIIANATADHQSTLSRLMRTGWRGGVLIEKPLFNTIVELEVPPGLDIKVAYNLRFHPLVRELKARLKTAPIYSATFDVGQYLPDWRPDSDYRLSYSASRSKGGGVLRDLSHELDLAGYFCGDVLSVAALGGKYSDLEIDADDVYQLIGNAKNCPIIAIGLNYLNRTPRRMLCLNGPGFTAILDFIEGHLLINGTRFEHKTNRDFTYKLQLKAFLEGDQSEICSLAEGMNVDKIIFASEKSASERRWISI